MEKEKEYALKFTIDELNSLVEMAFLGELMINGHRLRNTIEHYEKAFKKIAGMYEGIHKSLKSQIYQEIKADRNVGDYLLFSMGDLVDQYNDAYFFEWIALKLAESQYEGYFGEDKDIRVMFAERVYLTELKKNGFKNISIRIRNYDKKLEEFIRTLKEKKDKNDKTIYSILSELYE